MFCWVFFFCSSISRMENSAVSRMSRYSVILNYEGFSSGSDQSLNAASCVKVGFNEEQPTFTMAHVRHPGKRGEKQPRRVFRIG